MSSIVPKNVATMSANAPTQMPMSLQKRLELSPAVDGDRPSSNVAVASAAPVAEAFEEGVAPYVSLEGMTGPKVSERVVLHREIQTTALVSRSRSFEAGAVPVTATGRRRTRRSLWRDLSTRRRGPSLCAAQCVGGRVAFDTRRFKVL